MDNFRCFGRIGEGAHGVVFEAKEITTGQKVAIKKIPLKRLDDGLPVQVLREIKSLQQCSESEAPGSENILRLRTFFAAGSAIMLVTDFMVGDLGDVIRDFRNPLTHAQSKGYCAQVMRGLSFVHSQNILHRDLKPSNLLIAPNRQLKIADFGLARMFDETRPMSHQVATRWYRAPELLYGARHYDFGVDLWAAGCICAELFTFGPFFPGQSDIEQLWQVLRTLGTPTADSWPQWSSLPDSSKITFAFEPGVDLGDLLEDTPQHTVDLIKGLLVYNSEKRVSAADCLRHPFFFTDPMPTHFSKLPLPPQQPLRFRTDISNLEKPLENMFPPSEYPNLSLSTD